MVPSCQSGFNLLAAEPPKAGRESIVSAARPTSSPKNRVWGFSGNPSGRHSRRRRFRSMFTPGSRACAYKTASGRHEWPNRDPIGELGFETLHLVMEPLFVRKLLLGINEPQMPFLLANVIESASPADASFAAVSVSGSMFSPPNPLAGFLNSPNLFDFVGNNPLDRVDQWGLWWWVIPTSGQDWGEFWEWLKTWGQYVNPTEVDPGPLEILNTGNDALKCGLKMYKIVPNVQNARNIENGLLNGPINAPITNTPTAG